VLDLKYIFAIGLQRFFYFFGYKAKRVTIANTAEAPAIRAATVAAVGTRAQLPADELWADPGPGASTVPGPEAMVGLTARGEEAGVIKLGEPTGAWELNGEPAGVSARLDLGALMGVGIGELVG
jgi:hypothetical protein